MTKRKGINILLVLLAAVAVLALSFVGARMGMASRAEAESAAEIPDAYSGIILAGYDRIKLRAEQNIFLQSRGKRVLSCILPIA